MLSFFLHDSAFFDQTERTDWSSLDAYKDIQTGMLLELNIIFKVEFAQTSCNNNAIACNY